MKPISDLMLGFRDAENYKRRENKELFNQIFLRTRTLDRLCEPSTFFLIGEKGTGKTAYAVYLANNEYNDNIATLRYIRETEYQKFVSMKQAQHLTLSDYTSIWKIIVYLLLAQQLDERERRGNIFENLGKFRQLKNAIDEYYQHAFSPEMIYAIQFAEEAKVAAELIAKHATIGGEDKTSSSFSESRFQTNLLYIQKQFEEAFRSMKLRKTHLLFIDGIDIRPSSIPYEDYELSPNEWTVS